MNNRKVSLRFGALVPAAAGALGLGMLVPGAANAAGMADGVVTTITSANADVILIGTALLALVVLIASIAWFKRAANK